LSTYLLLQWYLSKGLGAPKVDLCFQFC